MSIFSLHGGESIEHEKGRKTRREGRRGRGRERMREGKRGKERKEIECFFPLFVKHCEELEAEGSQLVFSLGGRGEPQSGGCLLSTDPIR